MHPELLPNKVKNKEKQKMDAIVQQDLGSHSGDETKIVVMGKKVYLMLALNLQFNLLIWKVMIVNGMK